MVSTSVIIVTAAAIDHSTGCGGCRGGRGVDRRSGALDIAAIPSFCDDAKTAFARPGSTPVGFVPISMR
jgi:hypothetical protein